MCPIRSGHYASCRRVLKPGGRVVMATNAAGHGKRFRDLHDETAGELGYTPTGNAAGRFTLDDLPPVQRVFGAAERHVVRNAFVFPTAEAALAYYASGLVDAIAERDAEGSHRGKLLPLMAARIEGIHRAGRDVSRAQGRGLLCGVGVGRGGRRSSPTAGPKPLPGVVPGPSARPHSPQVREGEWIPAKAGMRGGLGSRPSEAGECHRG